VVGLVSLGCVKNLVDSEKMLGQLAESGAIISGDESAADTIVVNTCGFLGAARDEVLEVLAGLAERKRRGELRRIVVAGCLVQRDGEKLLEAVPEIDALVGVNNRDDVARAVWPVRDDPTGRMPVPHQAGNIPVPHADRYLSDYHAQAWSDRGRLRLTPSHYAYVRVSEGCDQKCTFCTIPAIRGPLRSKTPDQIVAECRELIGDGARELILIGQDTTSYGEDIGYEPGLAGLLRELDAECDEARWMRLMYVYPSIMTDAMIGAIAECERVVNYVDIPLQHINDRVLKAMYRRVTRKQTEELLERIRRRIPGVTIRTTFIVGFPGETEAEFQELLDFVRDFGFDAAGAFKFSPEPDTPAGRMKDQLDEAVKQERYDRLMLAQQEVAFAAARQRIGQSFKVVVDEAPAEGPTVARHAGQAPEVDSVCLLDRSTAVQGEWLRARCVDTDDYDLTVEPDR
jgi:ribosomal protein S12 methylthiotransferase